MRTIVIGGGGVGSVIAGYLSSAGRDVTVFDAWFQHVTHVQRHGLLIEAPEGHQRSAPDYRHLDALEDFGAADLIVIAVKSYDTSVAARIALPHVMDSTIVVSAQNGMNDIPIGRLVGVDRMVGSVIEFGAHLLEPGRVRRTSAKDSNSIVFGSLTGLPHDPRPTRLATYFKPLGEVRTVGDIWPERWSKLMLNGASNALAGITDCTTDALWSNPQTADIVVALGHEIATLATANQVTLSPVFGRIPHAVWTSAQRIDDPGWCEVRAQLASLAVSRAGNLRNVASLLQDVRRGRRTEIDYLNGWVIAAAARVDVAVPTHRMLVELLAPVERGEVIPAPEKAGPLHDSIVSIYG